MKYDRTRRIAEGIRRELAGAFHSLLDHAQASFLSVTAVRLTRDLAFAKVYVTLVGQEAERSALIKELNAKAGLFRHHLAQNMTVRKVPSLTFIYDDSIEYGARMEALLTDLVKDLPDDESAAP